MIFGQGFTDGYRRLATARAYRDFNLSRCLRCEADGNSGVYIHTAFDCDALRIVAGRQIEIDRTLGRHTRGLYGDGRAWTAWRAPQY